MKAKTKHTKGEWKITTLMAKDKRLKCFWYSIQNVTGATIADVKGRHCGIKNTEAEANAKLIASAPEMLEILQAVLLTGVVYNRDKIIEIIKKATE